MTQLSFEKMMWKLNVFSRSFVASNVTFHVTRHFHCALAINFRTLPMDASSCCNPISSLLQSTSWVSVILTHAQPQLPHLFSSTWTLRRPTKASIIGQSALGILQCIGNNTHPECAHAIDTCARHCVSPQQAHRNALKKIGHHLKGVLDDGLIIDPKRDLSLDCCVDADFAGNCNAKEIEDPATV